MKKKTYIKPLAARVAMMQQATILAGSQDNWADSKKDNTGSGLWDDDDDYEDEAQDAYDPYHGW